MKGKIFNNSNKKLLYYIMLAVALVFALFLAIPVTRYGIVGLLGWAAVAYDVALAAISIALLLGKKIKVKRINLVLYAAIFFIAVCTLHALLTKDYFLGGDKNGESYIAAPFKLAIEEPHVGTVGGAVAAIIIDPVKLLIGGYGITTAILVIILGGLGLVALLPVFKKLGECKLFNEKPKKDSVIKANPIPRNVNVEASSVISSNYIDMKDDAKINPQGKTQADTAWDILSSQYSNGGNDKPQTNGYKTPVEKPLFSQVGGEDAQREKLRKESADKLFNVVQPTTTPPKNNNLKGLFSTIGQNNSPFAEPAYASRQAEKPAEPVPQHRAMGVYPEEVTIHTEKSTKANADEPTFNNKPISELTDEEKIKFIQTPQAFTDNSGFYESIIKFNNSSKMTPDTPFGASQTAAYLNDEPKQEDIRIDYYDTFKNSPLFGNEKDIPTAEPEPEKPATGVSLESDQPIEDDVKDVRKTYAYGDTEKGAAVVASVCDAPAPKIFESSVAKEENEEHTNEDAKEESPDDISYVVIPRPIAPAIPDEPFANKAEQFNHASGEQEKAATYEEHSYEVKDSQLPQENRSAAVSAPAFVERKSPLLPFEEEEKKPAYAYPEEDEEPPAEKPEEEKDSIFTENAMEKMLNYKYNFPPLDILKVYPMGGKYVENYQEMCEKIESAFGEYGMEVKVIAATRGPTFTLYEVELGKGIDVKKVESKKTTILMRLSVKNLRLIAPLKGKNAIGLEIENDKRDTVGLRQVLTSEGCYNSQGGLVVGFGMTNDGTCFSADISKMPHLLIAGATGGGKSVFMHNIIMSILYKYSPEEVRLLMIDPKQIELSMYDGIPHMLVPQTVKNAEQAVNLLMWATAEMDRRYAFFNKFQGCNCIENYNEFARDKTKEPMMYRLVIIIDEMSDLMITSKGEVEKSIVRLSQLGRACGIHLVIATQRPTVDVVTGKIKGNILCRVAFAVNSAVDSTTILDRGGAEDLLGTGDMLYSGKGGDLTRMQSAYTNPKTEVVEVCNFIREHNPSYYDDSVNRAIFSESYTKTMEEHNVAMKSIDRGEEKDSEDNELIKKALATFILSKKASVSLLQTRYSVGFGRAKRIVEKMRDLGYISNDERGSKGSEVLITAEQYNAIFGENLPTESAEQYYDD